MLNGIPWGQGLLIFYFSKQVSRHMITAHRKQQYATSRNIGSTMASYKSSFHLNLPAVSVQQITSLRKLR